MQIEMKMTWQDSIFIPIDRNFPPFCWADGAAEVRKLVHTWTIDPFDYWIQGTGVNWTKANIHEAESLL